MTTGGRAGLDIGEVSGAMLWKGVARLGGSIEVGPNTALKYVHCGADIKVVKAVTVQRLEMKMPKRIAICGSRRILHSM